RRGGYRAGRHRQRRLSRQGPRPPPAPRGTARLARLTFFPRLHSFFRQVRRGPLVMVLSVAVRLFRERFMTEQTPCPDHSTLQQLVLGQLTEHEAAPVEEHLQDCPHCALVLEGLHCNDQLTAAVRDGAAQAACPERTEVVRLLGYLEPMPPLPV